MEALASAFLILVFLLSPALAFVAGFWSGTVRIFAIRWIITILVIMLPLALLGWPLVVPGASDSERFGAGFGLVLFGLPLAMWMLLASFGAFVGSARRKGSN